MGRNRRITIEDLMKRTTPPKDNPVHYELLAPKAPILVWLDEALVDQFIANIHRRNRVPSMTRAEDWRDKFLEGDYALTHQGGAVAEDGESLDLTHRLLGMKMAMQERPGLRIPMWIFPDCLPSLFMKIDQGWIRTQEHLFIALGGVKTHAKQVTGAAKVWLRGITVGNWKARAHATAKFAKKHETLIRNVLASVMYGKKPQRGSPKLGCPCYSHGFGGALCKAAFYYGEPAVTRIAQRYVEGADENGHKLLHNDPMFAFREWIEERHEQRKDGKEGYLTSFQVYPMAVTAIRAALQGRPLSYKDLCAHPARAGQDFGELASDKKLAAVA